MAPRRWCSGVAMLVMAAACAGGDSSGDAEVGEGVVIPAVTTTVPSGPGATSPAPRSPGTAGRSPHPAGARPVPTTRVMPPESNYASLAEGPVGAFAGVLLQPRPATSLVVEILQQRGQPALRPGTVAHLTGVLAEVSGKPVKVSGPIPLDTDARRHSNADIIQLADEEGRAEQGGGQAVIHVLVLDGTHAESDGIAGVAVRGDVVAIFPDVTDSAAGPLVSPATVEDAVVMHETGHLLGLVDLVLPTGRQDPDHPGHSRNRASVMFWAIETDLVVQVLDGPPPTEFDAEDRRDLATIRGGG